MNLKTTLKKFPDIRKAWIGAFLLLLSMATANAQSVSGTVTADGQPLPGATVLEKGTSNGTSTDFDGNFTINSGSGST